MSKLVPFVVLAACAAGHPAAAPTTPAADFALAGRRAQMIEWLREYDDAGTYPTDERGMPLGVFRDAHGVLCPMAYLIHRSGRDDLVNLAVRTNNRLRLAEVHAGPIHDWMASSGLTSAEIAMVQGAMQIDEGALMAPLVAHAEVHGRLETSVTALKTLPASRTIVASRQSSGTRR